MWAMLDDPVRVVASVIGRGDRYLVCRRPVHKRHGGLWEFPGGKCEPGESDADAVRRELAEELGVETTRVGDLIFEVRDSDSAFLIVFVPVQIDGEPVCLEHTELRWCTRKELVGLSLAPSDRRFVDFLSQTE
jgi:mutator protein MutT